MYNNNNNIQFNKRKERQIGNKEGFYMDGDDCKTGIEDEPGVQYRK